ncbi:hypothetical protein [Nocardia sp. NPDC003979]
MIDCSRAPGHGIIADSSARIVGLAHLTRRESVHLSPPHTAPTTLPGAPLPVASVPAYSLSEPLCRPYLCRRAIG